MKISVSIIKEKNFIKSFTINNSNDLQSYIKNYDFDNPDAIDWPFFKRAVDSLEKGKPFDTPVYDFFNNKRILKTEKLQASNLIIIEGRIFWNDEYLLSKCNIKIFLDTDLDLMLSRNVYKNIARGRNLNDVLDRYVKFVKPGYMQWIEPTKVFADLVVPNFGGGIYDVKSFEYNQILAILMDLLKLRLNIFDTLNEEDELEEFELEVN